jgi:hypothetical protein
VGTQFCAELDSNLNEPLNVRRRLASISQKSIEQNHQNIYCYSRPIKNIYVSVVISVCDRRVGNIREKGRLKSPKSGNVTMLLMYRFVVISATIIAILEIINIE